MASLVLAGPRWRPWAELRIDVALPPESVEAELARLSQRLRPWSPLLRHLDLGLPGVVFRWREADGEQYVYGFEAATGRLVACTVFNRLVELDRRADRYLRGPHTKVARAWQRRGIAQAVYRWALARGMCLITGARQSEGAHALWQVLAATHPLGYVRLAERRLTYLGEAVPSETLEDFHTRMVLLGAGWDLGRFLAATRAQDARDLVS